MKKLRIIFLFILCLASKMFAAEATDSGDLSGLLTGGNDYQATSYGKCRKVKSGYAAEVTGYDFINGITFCSIVPDDAQKSGIPIPKTVNANTLFYQGSWVAQQKSLTGTEAELKLTQIAGNLAGLFETRDNFIPQVP